MGSGSLDVICLHVGLSLVEANVESAGARSVNVPVRVSELRLVALLGAVKFGGSTSDVVGVEVATGVANGAEARGSDLDLVLLAVYC